MSDSNRPILEVIMEATTEQIKGSDLEITHLEQQKGSKSHPPRLLITLKDGTVAALEFSLLEEKVFFASTFHRLPQTEVKSVGIEDEIEKMKREAEKLLNE